MRAADAAAVATRAAKGCSALAADDGSSDADVQALEQQSKDAMNDAKDARK